MSLGYIDRDGRVALSCLPVKTASPSPRKPKLHGPSCCSCQFCTMLRKGWTIISPDGWVFRA